MWRLRLRSESRSRPLRPFSVDCRRHGRAVISDTRHRRTRLVGGVVVVARWGRRDGGARRGGGCPRRGTRRCRCGLENSATVRWVLARNRRARARHRLERARRDPSLTDRYEGDRDRGVPGEHPVRRTFQRRPNTRVVALSPRRAASAASRRELLAALVGGQKRVNVIGLRLRRRHSHLCDGGAKHVCRELVEVLLCVPDIDTVEPIVRDPSPVEQQPSPPARQQRHQVSLLDRLVWTWMSRSRCASPRRWRYVSR